MQTTETLSQGLKREYQVVLRAAELASPSSRPSSPSMKDKVRINGFRPGKVPAGPSEAPLWQADHGRCRAGGRQRSAPDQIVTDNKPAPRRPAEDRFAEDRAEMEKVLEATGDLKFSLVLRGSAQIRGRLLRRHRARAPDAEVPDEEVEQQLDQLAERNRTLRAARRGRSAQSGDKLTIDFVGKIGDEAFEGGTAEGVDLVLGSGQFIPGFEAQLEGAKAGDERTVNRDLPGGLSGCKSRRQGSGLRRHGQGGRRAWRRRRSTTSLRQEFRLRQTSSKLREAVP